MLDELALGDPRMATNVRYVKMVQDREIPILIYGETGTGKEVMARAIHASRDGDRRPFIAVNCASIPETLIESELFGYSPGAFTGALREGQKGMIYQADKGTLFLDEIGDMPIQLQSRLLRVLEEREIQPLGGEKSVKVDIALLSATHRDLTELVAAGRFRSDLYYRLQGLVLSLPPLRERSDKRSLIRHMIELESQRHTVMGGGDVEKPQFTIDEHALQLLEKYDWPGNIRQLRNVIRVALAVCSRSTITVDVLPQEIRSKGASLNGASLVEIASRSKTDQLKEHGTTRYDELHSGLNAVEKAERTALMKELEKYHWNIASVARSLNLSRPTLYRKMKRLGIRK
jgi:transcriptional regulator of acetoin/glycerol metabolism